jgi:plastocyanin
MGRRGIQRLTIPLVGLVVLTLTLSCSSSEDSPTPAPPAATNDGAVVTGLAAGGAVLSLHPAHGEAFPMPAGPAVMDQYSRQFVPEQLFVRVGQVVEFRNSEDVDHNVQVLRRPTGTTVMNESGSKGQVFTHTFTQSGWYEVICDVHPGMRATIVATSSAYAALADESGRFAIRGVPPGAYVLNVEANGRVISREVTVKAPETAVSVR